MILIADFQAVLMLRVMEIMKQVELLLDLASKTFTGVMASFKLFSCGKINIFAVRLNASPLYLFWERFVPPGSIFWLLPVHSISHKLKLIKNYFKPFFFQ